MSHFSFAQGKTGNKRGYFVVAVAVLAVLLIFPALRGGGPDNSTPEGAVAIFVKAMVTRDRDLMDKINHSGPLEYPTYFLMEMATTENWAQYDIKKFAYRQLGRGLVEITFPDGRKERAQMVEENGRWYFVSLR